MQFGQLKRREFITLVGVAAAWPLVAQAQQRERMRRIGVLLPATADDSDFQAWVGAFQQALAQSGWIIGRHVRIDTRWGGGKSEDIRRHATELVALTPEVILAHGTSTVRPLVRRPAAFRSCSRLPAIRSAPVLSTAWRSLAATSPDSCRSNTASAANCWSYSKRLRPA